MSEDEKVKQFKRELKAQAGWIEEIKSLESERIIRLAELDHKMSGLAHSGTELSEKQMKSSLPMPTSSNHGQGISYESLIQKKDEINREYYERKQRLQYMVDRVLCVLEAMPETERSMTLELYVHDKYMPEYIADKYGYTIWGLRKHVDISIKKALRVAKATEKADKIIL